MRLLGWLFGGFKKLMQEDPQLGVLRYHKAGLEGSKLWEGELAVPWLDHPVTLLLPGDESGPLSEAREFAGKALGGFPTWLEAARPFLAETFVEEFNEELPEQLISHFNVWALDFEWFRDAGEMWKCWGEWAATADPDDLDGALFTLSFAGERPTGISEVKFALTEKPE